MIGSSLFATHIQHGTDSDFPDETSVAEGAIFASSTSGIIWQIVGGSWEKFWEPPISTILLNAGWTVSDWESAFSKTAPVGALVFQKA
jgi:hypothetical protein